MNELIYEFIEYLKRKKYAKMTVHDYGKTIGEFFVFLKKTYPDVKVITDVDREIVVSYEKFLVTKKDIRGKVITRNRRRRYLSYLKKFFLYLEREEKIFKNPTTNIALPRERNPIVKDILSIEEMEKVLRVCAGDSTKSLRDRSILELMYSTGIRAEELCGIEVNDVDFNENTLFVRKGKWGNERLVPFGKSAGYWVERYMSQARPLIAGRPTEHLFFSLTGKKLQPQALLDIVKQCASIAGIAKNVTCHTFRHSCATHMLKGKADIRYVQKQLGHKRISTTERYLKVEISDLKEVHERTHPREQDDWE